MLICDAQVIVVIHEMHDTYLQMLGIWVVYMIVPIALTVI